MGLTRKIAKWSLGRLLNKGDDLSTLFVLTKERQELKEEISKLNEELNLLSNQFNIKRAEIIEEQTDLINIVEPSYMTMLAESKDNTLKTTMTKIWLDKFNTIDSMVEEHEKLIQLYAKKHQELLIKESEYEV